MDFNRLRQIDRASGFSFAVGILAGDLTFRLSAAEIFRAAFFISVVLAAAALLARAASEKFPMVVTMFAAGFAFSSFLKWTLLS